MKKLLSLAILAIFTLNNAQSVAIPQSSLMSHAQNCIKQIVCADKIITDQNIIDQLYNISDYMKTYCSTQIGSNKDTLDLKTDLNIDSSILTDILDINNEKINITETDKNKLEEIFLVADYLLVDIFHNLNIWKGKVISLKKGLINVRISNNSKFAVVSNLRNNTLYIIDIQNGDILHTISGCSDYFQISLNDKLIVSHDMNGKSIYIIDSQSGVILNQFKGNYSSTKISYNNKFIAAYNRQENSLDIIDIQNGNLLNRYEGNYNNFEISHNNKFIVAYNDHNRVLSILNLENGSITHNIYKRYIRFEISYNDKFIAAYDYYSNCHIYEDDLVDIIDTQTGYTSKQINSTLSFQLSHDSKFIISNNTKEYSVSIIDINSGNIIYKFCNYSDPIISQNNEFLIAYNMKNKSIDVIDIKLKKVLISFNRERNSYVNYRLKNNYLLILNSSSLTIINLQTEILLKNLYLIPYRYLYSIRDKLDKSQDQLINKINREIKLKEKNISSFLTKQLNPSLINALIESPKFVRYVEKKTNHPIQDT